MFCKWCGNKIQTTEERCSSCGRETPPMSDCGGFYNLKHSKNSTPVPTQEPAPVQEKPQCPVIEKLTPKYVKDRKAAKNHHMLTMICFAVVLIAIVCTAVLVVQMYGQIEEIKEQIVSIQAGPAVEPTEDDGTEPTENPTEDLVIEPTEATTDPTVVTESLPYSFMLGVTVKNAEGIEIGTAYDFGDYAKTANVTTVVSEDESGQEIVVSFILAEGATINLDVVYAQEKTEDNAIGVKCNSDISFFDNLDFTYEWQYRTGTEDWLPADEELVIENDEYLSLLCDEKLWSAVGEEGDLIDIRCIITAVNEEGDMMTITVNGFTLSQNVQLD